MLRYPQTDAPHAPKPPVTPDKPKQKLDNPAAKPKTRPGPSRLRSEERRSPPTIVTTGRADRPANVGDRRGNEVGRWGPGQEKAFR